VVRTAPRAPVRTGGVGGSLLPPAVLAVLRKEWMTLRSNSTQWMGFLTPLFFVFVLSRGITVQHPTYLLPGAIAYALLGPMASAYNVFGGDGPGVQVYLLAPARLRDVVLGKNLASLLLLCAQAAVSWWIAAQRSTMPIPLASEVTALLWLIFTLALNLAIGTRQSIQAPRRQLANVPRMARSAPASRTSALLVIAVVLASVLLEVAVTRLGVWLHLMWLPAGVFAGLAALALAVYGWMLANVEGLILRNRDVLEHELCGVTD
jgi:ABC-2 type transport system permease protein